MFSSLEDVVVLDVHPDALLIGVVREDGSLRRESTLELPGFAELLLGSTEDPSNEVVLSAVLKDFAQRVQQLLRGEAKVLRACTIVIPARGIVSSTVVFPFSDREQIRKVLPLELQDRLPFDVDDVELTFTVNDAPTSSGEYEVLVTLCSAALLERLRLFCAQFELIPVLVLPRTAALLADEELVKHKRALTCVFETGDDVQISLVEAGRITASAVLVARREWAAEEVSHASKAYFAREVLLSAHMLMAPSRQSDPAEGDEDVAKRELEDSRVPLFFLGPAALGEALQKMYPAPATVRPTSGHFLFSSAARLLTSGSWESVSQNLGNRPLAETLPFRSLLRASKRLLIPAAILVLAFLVVIFGQILMYQAEIRRIQTAMSDQLSAQLGASGNVDALGLLAQVERRAARLQSELDSIVPAMESKPLAIIEVVNGTLSDPGLKSISLRSLSIRGSAVTITGSGESYLAVDRLRNTLRRQPHFDSVRDASGVAGGGTRRGEIGFSLTIQVNQAALQTRIRS